MSYDTQKLPLREKVCYGFGDLASCLFWQTITFYLLFFYLPCVFNNAAFQLIHIFKTFVF